MSEITPPLRTLPHELPVLPLREFVLFPYMALPLFVARPQSISVLDDAMAGHRLVMLVVQRDAEDPNPGADGLHTVGTIATITHLARLKDGRVKAIVQGITKARIDATIQDEDTLWVRATPLADNDQFEWNAETQDLLRAVRGRVEQLLPLKNLPPEILSMIATVERPGRLADLVASHLALPIAEAQRILEIEDPIVRLCEIDGLLRRELEAASLQAEKETQPKEQMTPEERETFLREQLRAIQAELGEDDARGDELDEYRVKVEEAQLSPDGQEEAARQLRRLERMHPDGPEAQVVRNYLDWVVDLPWNRCSPDRLDLNDAREILDADHAHLEPVKDRILEYLGVRRLRDDSRGPILCLSGPPGVGKTSLGRSIARAMGREFVRVSLGGVRDEAEIRGHRRTYVGAMPGRLIQAMKQAGTSNPVIMLDEIDKLGNDFRGDPSAALLEVLDPEQNDHFSDHFLNLPFDLSRVLFIATANLLEPIPAPLRDRMEVIQLSGYTPEEKVEITHRFMIPRQINEHGLDSSQISWSRGSVQRLVTEYTHEAGVRELERQVATVCRKVARQAAEGNLNQTRITQRSIERHLGPPPWQKPASELEDEVGVVKGLAWTQAGGEVLPVEAALTPGQGLLLTGQLGDVMKESGQTALSYVRSIVRDIGIDDAVLGRSEIHVHVPNGATPKDGPSAGVTIATAIASLATGTAVRGDVAMTGEVTLRGRVLAVGGVREKAMAALRSGISRIIVPRTCMKDIAEIPKEIRRKIQFIPVTDMREVLAAALVDAPLWQKRGRMPAELPTMTSAAAFSEEPSCGD
ncbi:MAG: endopeptidase La [bacterium TMED88]|nr:endopeptidase La [Deltaproteobacteria bacterium]OUV28521.1 MAG: endopeptidase La [bacterium TMED88]